MPDWRTSPRAIAMAVISTLPGWANAQALAPLEIDPGLLVAPVVKTKPVEVPVPASNEIKVKKASDASAGAKVSAPVATQSTPAVATPARVAPATSPATTVTPATSSVSKPAAVQNATASTAKPAIAAALAAGASNVAFDVSTPSKKDKNEPNVTHVEAKHMSGRQDVDLYAYDDVRLTRGDLTVTSDKLFYDQLGNEVTAEGNVVLVRQQDRIEGPKAHVNLDTWVGEFETPDYELHRERVITGEVPARGTVRMLKKVTATGHADELKFEGENQYRLANATYSSCPAPDPDWYLKVSDLQLDYDREIGTGNGSTLYFKNVPIGYLPWAEFPLTSNRQSGFLPPTMGYSSTSGLDLSIPYYFNLAPNYDATLTPRYLGRRGTQIGGETRYLTPDFNGVLRGEWLPNDQVAEKTRAAISWTHNQDFRNGFTSQVIFNQVSDPDYFADLSSKIGSTSTATLNRQLITNYSNGAWLTGAVNIQKYQTLSGEAPYALLPKLSATAQTADYHGFSLALPMEYAKFSHPTKDEGDRVVLYPQIGFPIQGAAYYITPKFGVHSTQYSLDRRTTTGDSSLTRSVPIFSVDSGLNFERDTTWNNRQQIQTLEPRLYYLRSSYVDQSAYPVFDTAKADFNFAQIFSENIYSGSDRIADANQLTAMVQSRMIEADTGEEWMKAGIGQRYYFADQRVTLPGETARTGRVADVLGAFTGRIDRSLWLDTALQYDPRASEWQKGTLGVRYNPAYAKVASMSYRFTKGSVRDLIFSAQWPVWQRWYGVAQYDRNLRDHQLSQAIVGAEYKADCWVFRGVWQSVITTKQTRNNTFFLQIEFNGLASVGSNPVNVLKRNVDSYGKINSPAAGDPVFGGDYED